MALLTTFNCHSPTPRHRSIISLPSSTPPSRASQSTSPLHLKLYHFTKPRAKSSSSSTASPSAPPSATTQSPSSTGSPSSTPLVQDLNLFDLRKKIIDLSRDMKQAHFTVSGDVSSSCIRCEF
ncbi:hypothetical protein EV1_012398 [Malus domestica]